MQKENEENKGMDELVFAFEFKNGIYVSYNTGEKADDRNKKFIQRDSAEFKMIDAAKITHKHLDIEFDFTKYSDWSEIKTPFLDMILDYQQLDEEVKKWIIAMLGRLLYPRKLHDDWNTIVFLHGVPDSGKSEILNAMVNIMGAPHVTTLTAEAHTKMLAVDESRDEPLDRPTMVTSIRSTIPHNPSMIMTARENPFLKGEHATRHIFPVKFEHTYKDKNVNLQKGLNEERGKILRKINEAYLEAVLEHGDIEDPASILPDYFMP